MGRKFLVPSPSLQGTPAKSFFIWKTNKKMFEEEFIIFFVCARSMLGGWWKSFRHIDLRHFISPVFLASSNSDKNFAVNFPPEWTFTLAQKLFSFFFGVFRIVSMLDKFVITKESIRKFVAISERIYQSIGRKPKRWDWLNPEDSSSLTFAIRRVGSDEIIYGRQET